MVSFICSSIVENDPVGVGLIVIVNNIMRRFYKCLRRYLFFLFWPFVIMSSEKMNLIPWILIIGALIIAFAFFSFTMLGWCDHTSVMPPLPATGVSFDEKYSACLSLESHSVTFQYKAELGAAAEGANQTQCVICLAPFEEEESVRKLHSCKHIFHTSCIDKWFGAHSGCPLCRSQIDKVASPNGTVRSEENSQMIFVNVNP